MIVSFHLNLLLGVAKSVLQLQIFPLKKGNTDSEVTPLFIYLVLSFEVNETVQKDATLLTQIFPALYTVGTGHSKQKGGCSVAIINFFFNLRADSGRSKAGRGIKGTGVSSTQEFRFLKMSGLPQEGQERMDKIFECLSLH